MGFIPGFPHSSSPGLGRTSVNIEYFINDTLSNKLASILLIDELIFAFLDRQINLLDVGGEHVLFKILKDIIDLRRLVFNLYPIRSPDEERIDGLIMNSILEA